MFEKKYKIFSVLLIAIKCGKQKKGLNKYEKFKTRLERTQKNSDKY